MADTAASYDIATIGEHLAGLALALQLNGRSPNLSIIVLERNKLPAPVAAHKV